jgi:hypothetical protein
MIRHAAVRTNELIKPMLADDATPVRVGVGAVVCARGRPIDGHTEPDLLPFICGSENEMQVAGAKPIGNAAALFIESGLLFTNDPIAAQ